MVARIIFDSLSVPGSKLIFLPPSSSYSFSISFVITLTSAKEEGETRVREEIAKDKYIDQNIPESKDTKLFFDEFSGRYFESTLYDLQNAVYNINRLYALHGSVSINELYKRLNLPPTDFGEVLGWSAYKDWENLGYAWIDIKWELMTMPDDLECYAISFDIAPTEDFAEW